MIDLSYKQRNKIVQMQGYFSEASTPAKGGFNPQFPTPPSSKQSRHLSNYEESIFQEVRALLHQDRLLDALKLFPESSFVRELITDHAQINKIHKILTTDAGTFQFDSIKFDSTVLGTEKQSRLSGLLQLKKSKCLNNTLVKNISSHLQDILMDQFDPLKSFKSSGSQIFAQLYDKLNHIQQKFDLLKSRSPQLPAFLQDRAFKISKQNHQLQLKLDETKNYAQKYQNEAARVIKENSQLKQSLKKLKIQQNKHLVRHLEEKKKFNLLLEQKEQQYKLQIKELKERSKISERMKLMEKDLDVTIEDFKNLIYKLSLQNKLLKEERDLLLSQLSKVYEKFHIFVALYQSSDPSQNNQLAPAPIQRQNNRQYQLQINIISELKGNLQRLQQEIKIKNETIERIKAEIQELKRQRDYPDNEHLDRTLSINQFSEQNEEKIYGKRYSRTKANQRTNKINQLEDLIRQDKSVIESLNLTVKQLTQKIKSQSFKNCEQTLTKRDEQPQQTSNTIQSLGQFKQTRQKRDEQTDKIRIDLKRKNLVITKLEQSLEQEKQTNISLNTIIQDLHSFEKLNEGVMTPRMLKQISELKDNIQDLTKRCKGLEDELKSVKKEKEEITKVYEEQISNLEFQCSEAQSSITNMENQINQLQAELNKKQHTLKGEQKESQSSQNEQNSKQLQVLLQERQYLSNQLSIKQQEIEEYKRQLDDASSKLKSMETAFNFTKTKSRDMEKKYKSIVSAKDFKEQFVKQIQHSLFNDDILQDKPFERHFLIETLQKRTDKVIRRTKLLWKFDALNKVNLHHYIDNNDNFVLLVELEGEYVIGAYSEGKLYPKMISDKDGFLFSLTKKEIFEPIEPKKRVLAYDDYYLIFGNSQIRIRSQENKIFSNFGLTSGFFKARGMKVDIITNSTEKEVNFKYVEVYQLQFL